MSELKINEIFFSIQGETSYVGEPTVFVRLTGCHLRCSYCDTEYAFYEGQKKTLDDIISEVQKHKTNYVCITGGEPLLQKPVLKLMEMLCDMNKIVSIETSGALPVSAVDPRVKRIIDVKTPSSQESKRFDLRNLENILPSTEFKFVIGSDEDFQYAERFSEEHRLLEQARVLYSPAFRSVSGQWLAEKILASPRPARLQLQVHKLIWEPETRGV